jgi:DNA repair exonuclease SbcCD nuclease subunit
MIKKIIACSDIHFQSLKGIDNKKKILEGFIQQCRDIANTEGRDSVRIVVGGDVFNDKLSITNESILAVNWFLKELDSICKTYVFAGNHDYLVKNTDRVDSITPIFEIGNLPNTVYLDKEFGYKSGCLVDDNVVWCLYSSFEGFNKPDIAIEKAKFAELGEEKTYVGLVHGDVNGAITTTNFVTEHGLDPAVFGGCDFVIAGHIHKRQEIKKDGIKIVYCSSIVQKDFGENISGHGFVLWDLTNTKDYTYQFVDVKNEDSGFYIFSIYDIKDIEDDFEELVNL